MNLCFCPGKPLSVLPLGDPLLPTRSSSTCNIGWSFICNFHSCSSHQLCFHNKCSALVCDGKPNTDTNVFYSRSREASGRSSFLMIVFLFDAALLPPPTTPISLPTMMMALTHNALWKPLPHWQRPNLDDRYQTIQIFKFQNQGMRFSSGGDLRQEYIGFGGWSMSGFHYFEGRGVQYTTNRWARWCLQCLKRR